MSKVFVTGGTGMVGKLLVGALLREGHQVTVLTRNASSATAILPKEVQIVGGDPQVSGPWMKALEGQDSVIHLAGENVAARRWTPSFKESLRQSRVTSTENLCQAIQALEKPPRVFVGASAIGWYGDTGDRSVDETSGPSSDFFGELCKDWEGASSGLPKSCRRVIIRVGVVLKKGQGALGKLEQPIRWGLGGALAGGRFFMSWVHWEDLIRLFLWAVSNPGAQGVYNGVAPQPVTNREMVREIAKRLHRPAIFPVPYWVLRLMVGEFAHYLCASQRVLPTHALQDGFQFHYPILGKALDAEYGSG